jgi:hypothetical protein
LQSPSAMCALRCATSASEQKGNGEGFDADQIRTNAIAIWLRRCRCVAAG